MTPARQKLLIRSSILNIVVTVFLASVKVGAGLFTDSYAMIMDAVSYYSDALIALAILLGAIYAHKETDAKHPYGYGRFEYVTTLFISIFVLYTAIQSIYSSVLGIYHRAESHLHITVASLLVLAVTAIVKLTLGLYMLKLAKETGADSVLTVGRSARRKALFSILTLLASLLFLYSGINLDRYLSLLLALLVLRAAIRLLKNTIGHILGHAIPPALAGEVKKTITSVPGVHGAYDLKLHNYGPDTYRGGVHIEVYDSISVQELDTILRKIHRAVLEKHAIELEGISIYARNTNHDHAALLEQEACKICRDLGAKSMHGFYINEEDYFISFDVVFGFERQTRKEDFERILRAMQTKHPDYRFELRMDVN